MFFCQCVRTLVEGKVRGRALLHSRFLVHSRWRQDSMPGWFTRRSSRRTGLSWRFCGLSCNTNRFTCVDEATPGIARHSSCTHSGRRPRSVPRAGCERELVQPCFKPTRVLEIRPVVARSLVHIGGGSGSEPHFTFIPLFFPAGSIRGKQRICSRRVA